MSKMKKRPNYATFPSRWLKITGVAATTDSHFAIAGVLVESHSGRLRIAATDGRRMIIVDRAADPDEKLWPQDFSGVIPSKLIKTFKDGEGKKVAIMRLANDRVRLDNGDSTYIEGQLREGEFPPYEKLIPDLIKLKKESDVVGIGPKLVCQTLVTMEQMADKDNPIVVGLSLHGKTKGVYLELDTINEEGVRIYAIVMPRAMKGEEGHE